MSVWHVAALATVAVGLHHTADPAYRQLQQQWADIENLPNGGFAWVGSNASTGGFGVLHNSPADCGAVVGYVGKRPEVAGYLNKNGISFDSPIARVDTAMDPACKALFNPTRCCDEREPFQTACGGVAFNCMKANNAMTAGAVLASGQDDARKVLRIVQPIMAAGLVAQVQVVMAQLRWAEENGMQAYVDMPKCQPKRLYTAVGFNGEKDPYYTESKGTNIWEYYFQQPYGYGRDVAATAATTSSTEVYQLSSWKINRLFGDDWGEKDTCPGNAPKTPVFYFVGCWEPHYRQNMEQMRDARWTAEWAAFFRKSRETGQRLMKRMPVNEEIRRESEEFFRTKAAGQPVLGLHVRWTDKQIFAGRQVKAAEYYPHVDRFLEKNPTAKIFVASADKRAVAAFRAKYGERVFASEFKRESVNSFNTDGGRYSGYQKGYQVLFDALVMSQTQFMLHGSAGVPELAIWLGKDMRLDSASLNLNFCHAPEGQNCDCGYYACGAEKATKP